MTSHQKELLPGLPVEIVQDICELMSALHTVAAERGTALHDDSVSFAALDDAGNVHYFTLRFDPERGNGEYVLVTHE